MFLLDTLRIIHKADCDSRELHPNAGSANDVFCRGRASVGGGPCGHWEDDALGRNDEFHRQDADRFKRVDDHTMLYHFTIDDRRHSPGDGPLNIRSWRPKGRIFEYACREAYCAIPDIQGGARPLENEGTEQ